MDPRHPVSIDTETSCFGPGNRAPKIVCASFGIAGGDPLLMIAEDATPVVESAFGKAELVAGHNIAYDTACLLEHAPQTAPAIWNAYEQKRVHCTQVRERLIDIARGSRYTDEDEEGNVHYKEHSLAAIATARLGRTLDKDTWRLNYAQLAGVPLEKWPQGAKDYAKDDASTARDVWYHQEAEIDRLFPHYAAWPDECGRQAAFAFALQLMLCWGVVVDPPRVQALREQLLARCAAATIELRAAGLLDPKKGSKKMAAIRDLIEAAWLGESEVPRTAKGAISTAAATIEQCDHPALDALVDFKRAEKQLSGLVDKFLAAGNDPIHAYFAVLGADSGRTSCSNPPLQQPPREPGVRECIKAREGCVLVASDYDSQELRALAQVTKTLTGRSALAERYQADPDYDPHTDFAAGLLGMSYADALRAKAAKDPTMLDGRQRAKAANFGFPGGMGARKFVLYAKGYGLRLTLDQAEALRAAWFQQRPEMRSYFQIITNLCDQGGGQAEIRQLASGRLRGGCSFPAAANTYFQGLGSEITKLALWEVTKRCYGAPGTTGSALLGCRPVLFLHDELVIEAPEAYAHEAAVELERVMCDAMEELTPDVPARASPALMRNWSKKAEAVFDEHGRYVPWEDRAK